MTIGKDSPEIKLFWTHLCLSRRLSWLNFHSHLFKSGQNLLNIIFGPKLTAGSVSDKEISWYKLQFPYCNISKLHLCETIHLNYWHQLRLILSSNNLNFKKINNKTLNWYCSFGPREKTISRKILVWSIRYWPSGRVRTVWTKWWILH